MRILETREVIQLEPVIEVARKTALTATCDKDHRGAVIFNSQEILGQASNGPPQPYLCTPEICTKICGLYAGHAERSAIINAFARGKNLNGASVLHVRVDWEKIQVQVSGNLRCDDCTGYMMRLMRKGIKLNEFILLQESGWTAYTIPEADYITRHNLGLIA